MRDTLKSKEYFENSLGYTNDCIIEFEELVKQVIKKQGEDSEGVKNGYNALIMYYTKKINLEYSIGKDINNIKTTYIKLLNYYTKMWDIKYGYIELVRILSMGVMLNIEVNYLKKLEEKIVSEGLDDYLVNFLLLFIDKNWKLNQTEFYFKGIYDPLKKIIEESDNSKRCSEIKYYLENQWYEIHSESAWYNSHKSKQNTYYGYWSFEAGALAKILNIPDDELKDTLYYPYDLVHYKG